MAEQDTFTGQMDSLFGLSRITIKDLSGEITPQGKEADKTEKCLGGLVDCVFETARNIIPYSRALEMFQKQVETHSLHPSSEEKDLVAMYIVREMNILDRANGQKLDETISRSQETAIKKAGRGVITNIIASIGGMGGVGTGAGAIPVLETIAKAVVEGPIENAAILVRTVKGVETRIINGESFFVDTVVQVNAEEERVDLNNEAKKIDPNDTKSVGKWQTKAEKFGRETMLVKTLSGEIQELIYRDKILSERIIHSTKMLKGIFEEQPKASTETPTQPINQ